MAKAFYNLLLQRKTEFLDHWDPRDLSSWDIEGGPRRRASSYMSLGPSSQNGSRVDLNRSEMSLGNMNPEARRSTDELRKSTDDLRKSRDELRRAGEHSAGSASPGPSRRAREDVTKREDGTKAGESSSPGPSRRSSQEGPEGGRAVLKGKPNKIFTGVTKYGDTAVRVNSPLSASTHFDETRTQPPAVGASDAISQQAGPSGWTASPANSTEHSRSSSANRATSSTADKKKLTIHIPVEEEEIAPRAASSEARARKPYLSDIERRHQDEVMSRFHRARLQGPPTPVITSSPKRSWFASIFNNFKPEPLHIKSTLEYQETQTLILELLQKIGVNKVEVYKDGWKIRYDGSGSSPSSTSSSAGPSSSSSGPSSSSGLSSAGQSAVGASPSASGPSVEQGNNSPSAMKFVKFHVTIGLDPEAPVGYIVEGPFRIQFTMLQGANSTFKHLVAQLSAWWEEATYVEPEPEPEFRTFFPEDEEEPQYPFRTFFPEDEAAEEEAAAARETMMGLR
ncbi:hypothetical protein DFJ77DRAFT_253120 [Powellomyces hirtus]|nr:hypothetical protein DFJ77DRAFT_253120 [Powellomyces hirtus]